jgi:hypothetical protein
MALQNRRPKRSRREGNNPEITKWQGETTICCRCERKGQDINRQLLWPQRVPLSLGNARSHGLECFSVSKQENNCQNSEIKSSASYCRCHGRIYECVCVCRRRRRRRSPMTRYIIMNTAYCILDKMDLTASLQHITIQ